MSKEELGQKFRDLAGIRLDISKILDLERNLLEVEMMQNVAPLVDELEL